MANLMNMREQSHPAFRKRREEQQMTPGMGPGSAVGMPPTGRDMVAAQASAPLYVTDEGEEVYLQDVIDVGGMGRLRAISGAPRAIKEAFYKMVRRNKVARQGSNKSTTDLETRSQLAKKATATRYDPSSFPNKKWWNRTSGGGDAPKTTLSPGAIGVGAGLGGAGILAYLSDVEEDASVSLDHLEPEEIKPDITPAAYSTYTDPKEGPWSPAAGGSPGGWQSAELPPQLRTLGEYGPEVVEEVKDTVDGVDASQIAPEKKQELERVWGKYTYSPKERHNKFMEQLNSIYMKAAWLDVIASITGGTSQSAQYISRATGKLEMMAKFDQEERVYNIWRDVYHDENGNYDPPKNKKEAAERARRLGASPEETQKIYGWSEEQDDLVSWWRQDADGKLETVTVHGKKERPDRGTGAVWNMGSPPDRLTAPVAKTPPVDKLIWAVGPDGVEKLYPESIVRDLGYTKSRVTRGMAAARAEATAALNEDPPNKEKATAAFEIYYRTATNQTGNLIYPDSMNAVAAAKRAVELIHTLEDMNPDDKIYTSEEEVLIDVRSKNTKPSGMSQENYELTLKRRARLRWKEEQEKLKDDNGNG